MATMVCVHGQDHGEAGGNKRLTELGIIESDYAPILATEKVALRLSTSHAEVEIDGLPMRLFENGQAVRAVVSPGEHAVEVSKGGHAPLTTTFHVPTGGFSGQVSLAPVKRMATVIMKSGREMKGILISQTADRVTLQRGPGSISLVKGQYERVELGGLAPSGESALRSTDAGPAVGAKHASDDRPSRSSTSAGDTGLPEWLGEAFQVARSKRDQHGNPLAGRRRRRYDRATGLPWEIWLKEPRMELVLILPGEFTMGSTQSAEELVRKYGGRDWRYKNELPLHKVRITKPFYLGKYEVTNAQYRYFERSHDSGRQRGRSLNAPDQPVVQVSWYQAAAFCEWLSQQTGADARLPTEAEWEYACRAGTRTPRYWGASMDSKRCNILGADSHLVTAPVGKFRPNSFGLHDTLGNVWEWCSDKYGHYRQIPAVDPTGSGRGKMHVTRGGSWYVSDSSARASARNGKSTTRATFDLGFRCAITARP